MKTQLSLIALLLFVSCAKESSSKKSVIPDAKENPQLVDEDTDPMTPGEAQDQNDGDFNLRRNYVGENVILNYNSREKRGMIRIKGKDAEKLHKFMALSPILIQAPSVKSDLEAKVGKHVSCHKEACWLMIDYKNGDVRENKVVSQEGKAPKIILTYRSDNLELKMKDRKGTITVEGMDAKALYSVMEVPEDERSGKGSASAKKTGAGVSCVKSRKSGDQTPSFKCEVEFNHRTGALSEV